MGLANLVPGISGGTMLLAAGIYPRFIRAIAELSTLKFRRASMLVLGAAGFFWHRRSQQAARQEVTGMLAQYFTPLAEGSGSGSGSSDRTRIENPIEFPSRGPAFQPPATTTSKDAALKDLAADAGAATDVTAV